MNTITPDNYQEIEYEMLRFPRITYQEYKKIPSEIVRKNIISRNKILKTDTYNRTMTYTKGEKKNDSAIYTLSLRRSPNGEYNVIAGIRERIKELFTVEFNQRELNFARDFYAEEKEKGGNSYFDEKMRQNIIDTYQGRLPIDIYAVDDGTVQIPGEPTLRVEGMNADELAAIFEPLYLRIYYESAVATDAHFLENLLGSDRVIEFGNRSVVNDDMHFKAMKSLYIGGGITGTSNDASVALYPQLHSTGTLAHRYFASFDTEDEAMKQAIEKNENIALLVDYADSYSGIDKVLQLKKQYPDRTIVPRLDSGNMVDQVLYSIQQHIAHGLTDSHKDFIIVSAIDSIDDIYAIEQAVRGIGQDPAQWVKYGMGGLLVAKNKTRSAVSAGYKLTQHNGRAKGKRSNSPGKEPTPGNINVEVREDKNERIIVQEFEPERGERLLKPIVRGGRHLFHDNDIDAIDHARKRVIETFQWKDFTAKKSATVQDMHNKVRNDISRNIVDRHDDDTPWTDQQHIYDGLRLQAGAGKQKKYHSGEIMRLHIDGKDYDFYINYLFMKLAIASDTVLEKFITYPHEIMFGSSFSGHGACGGPLLTADFIRWELQGYEKNGNISRYGLTEEQTSNLFERMKKILAKIGKTVSSAHREEE